MNLINKTLILAIFSIMGLTMSAQLGSYGNTYIQSGEMVLHKKDAIFSTSGAGTLPGIIATNRSNMAYVGFFGPSMAIDGADNKYIDGYAKSYNMASFIFPIGDNGNYGPVKVTSAAATNIYSAAYFFANATTAVTSSVAGGNEPALPLGAPFNTATFESKLKGISPVEYWDIDGTAPAKISLTWDAKSNITTLTGGVITNLTIAGWDGTKWVEIPSTVDATSVLGAASSLAAGSITSSAELTPNTFKVYTFGTKSIIVSPPIGIDTTIKTDDSTKVVIGTPIIPPTGTTMTVTISGPKVAGTATVDSQGVITIIPVSPQFVGKDTVRKIVCFTSASENTICDTSYIFINNSGFSVSSTTQTDQNTPVTTTSKLAQYTFEGGEPTIKINGPSNGVAKLNADGTVTYTPNKDFVGQDVVEIVRCDVLGNCVVDSFYFEVLAVKKEVTVIPNYFTPNGDGVNDNFDLSVLTEIYPNLKLAVYNRWGNIVYRSPGPYKNDWTGTHGVNNEPLPDGVYYYIVELSNEFQDVKTGFVQIMRQ